MSPAVEEINQELFKSAEGYQHICGLFYKLWTEKEQYRKMLFGEKKERFIASPAEQIFFEGLLGGGQKVCSTAVAAHTRHTEKKDHPGRNILPPHLERKVLTILPDEVQGNEKEYEKIGEEVSEQLEMKPARFWVKRTVRPKFKKKDTDNISCAPMPADLFAKFSAGGSVIANVLVSKYTDHLPLYRINKIFKRSKIDITESTMVGWIAFACEYLGLLYNVMKNSIKDARLIQADESPIPVLEPGNPKAHRGYMFVYVVDKRFVLYDYCRGRGSEGPIKFLQDFTGIIQTDGYDGYLAAVKKNNLIHIACMAHIRRKFFEAAEKGEIVCNEALILIGALYDIERDIKGADVSVIAEVRQEKSAPVYNELLEWAREKQTTVIPQCPTGRAISYFLSEHKKMYGYIDNPLADIDNNLCERTIRPMTIGRKNYLFAGSEEGAKRAAIIYSLSLTCRMHGTSPYEYYLNVFDRMAREQDADLRSLLPDVFSG